MEELPLYVPLQDRDKDVVDDLDSDEEVISTCEEAFLSQEQAKGSSKSDSRLRQFTQKLLPLLRVGVQGLLPSFLLPESQKRKKLHSTAWLDGLRGIAALLVVIHHASLLGFSWDIHDGWAPSRHQTAWFVRLPVIRLLISGPPQVAIFFVVSGYAISHKALKLSHQGRFAEAGSSLFSSVFRRHPRLFMPAGIVVLCTALITLLDPTWFGTDGFSGVAVPTRTVPQASSLIGQLRNWYDGEIQSSRPISNGFYEQADPHINQNPYDPNLWTLPMEFSSSMVVFLFLMACTRLHNRIRMALALFLIIYLQYYFDFPALHMFLSGMLICDLHFNVDDILSSSHVGSETCILSRWARARGNIVSRMADEFERFYVIGRIIGISVFIFDLWLLSTPEMNYGVHESWGYITLSSWVSPWYGDHFLSPYGAILVVLTLDHTPFLQALFTNRFSQYMGKISYSLYMIHGPLLWSVGLKLAHLTVDHVSGGDTDTKYFWGMMLAFGLWWPMAIYLSDLTVRHIDNNCVALSKWVYENLSKKDTAKST